ncbi:MAG: hypothetical protein HHJ14_00975 [Cellulomonas sp.]|uniref:hypothetical protein n=1 Tax=Cellulomonas sp. TaxID=40001 RepID=UPI001833C10B|nr:hypothetical protein [Cellulomonas sp.]NMM15739.1 hypothetical protein [Cellulomonas sp.]NMM32365.1 hypothetical protein [Cellulomonas sp.]
MALDTQTRRIARSAPLIGSGLVLLGIGCVAYQVGLLAELGAGRSGRYEFLRSLLASNTFAQAATLLGALTCVVGFGTLVVGVHRLASNLDAVAEGRADATDRTPRRDVTPV